MVRLCLKELTIHCKYLNNHNGNPILRLISCYQSSLVKLTLNIQSYRPIDGVQFEALLRSCQRLNKFVFIIQYAGFEVDIDEQLRQFQTDWWLNINQPPILILRNEKGHTLICSMPCTLPVTYQFPTDLRAWRLNKGDLGCSFVSFKQIQSIRFANSPQQPVTLEFLRFADRTFRQFNQKLTFQFWGLDLSDILFEQVSFIDVISFYMIIKIGKNERFLLKYHYLT